MLDRIGAPLDLMAELQQSVARCHAHCGWDDAVVGAVAHENRHIAIRGGGLCCDGVTQRQIGRQREDAAEAFRLTQSRMQCDRAAL